jgi:hypothetical protein
MMNNNVSDPGNDVIEFISNRMSAGARLPPTDHPLDLACELVSTGDMIDRVLELMPRKLLTIRLGTATKAGMIASTQGSF